MVVENEASCPKCFTENQYSITMQKNPQGVYECRFGHRYKEKADGYLTRIE